MALLRWIRKLVLIPLLGLGILIALALLASQVEQHVFRYRAERLLSDIQSIELRKTTWQEAESRLGKWGAQSKLSDRCDSQECSVQIELDEFVMRHFFRNDPFEEIDNYLRWRLKLSPDSWPLTNLANSFLELYMRAGGHPTAIRARVGMRDGIAWSKGISVYICTFARLSDNDPRYYAFALMAEIQSTSRNDWLEGIVLSPGIQLQNHPEYEIGRPGGCESCIDGWVKFTPFASPSDIRRLMHLDFSCLTRLQPCTSQAQIMPDAWAQYLRENSSLSQPHFSEPSPGLLVVIGRDSPVSFSAELLSDIEVHSNEDICLIKVKAKVLESLKGTTDWKNGENRVVTLLRAQPCKIQELKPGTRWILFLPTVASNLFESDPGLEWAAIPMTLENLGCFRKGIEQSLTSPPETEVR
jgi:hypothetical protein